MNCTTCSVPCDYRAAAEELGLIVNSDQMLSLAVDRKHIASIDAMRQYINTKLAAFFLSFISI